MVGPPLWGPRFVTRIEEEEEDECYDNIDDACITCICCFCLFIIYFGVFNLIKSARRTIIATFLREFVICLLSIACSLFICLLSLFIFGLFVYSFVLNACFRVALFRAVLTLNQQSQTLNIFHLFNEREKITCQALYSVIVGR